MHSAFTTLHNLIEVKIVDNKIGLLSLCRCSLRMPTKQGGNCRFVLNPRIAHLAPYQDTDRSYFRSGEACPNANGKNVTSVHKTGKTSSRPKKLFRNTHKASDRESALQLPRTNRCNPKLWECISDHSLHASYCWRRVSIITHLFFSWCIYPSIVPPLDGKQCKHQKRQEGCEW
jgi:hypothetical protein